MFRIILFALLVNSVEVLLARPAIAQEASKLPKNTLYACNFRSNSRLFKIDTTTSEETEVGRIGEECTDIAFLGDKLYGISFTSFFEIDPITGEASEGIEHEGASLNSLIAAGPSKPNMFYAAGSVDETGNGADFVQLDRNTGKATTIGQLGEGLSSAGDFAYVNDKLYVTLNRTGYETTWLATINSATGKATLIVDTGVDGIWGMETRNGVLYGATKDGMVLRIEPRTGSCFLIGTTGIVLGGMAKSP